VLLFHRIERKSNNEMGEIETCLVYVVVLMQHTQC